MKYGKTIILKNAKENGKEVVYRLIESEGNNGNKSYTVMVFTQDEISYLEDVSCDLGFSEQIINELFDNRVSPLTLYDVLEEII